MGLHTEVENYNKGQMYTITRFNEDGTVHHTRSYMYMSEHSVNRLLQVVEGWETEESVAWDLDKYYREIKRTTICYIKPA